MDGKQLHSLACQLMIEGGTLDSSSFAEYLSQHTDASFSQEQLELAITATHQQLNKMYRQQHAIAALPNGFADSLNQWFVQLNQSIEARVDRLTQEKQQSWDSGRLELMAQHQQQLGEQATKYQTLEADMIGLRTQLAGAVEKTSELQTEVDQSKQQQQLLKASLEEAEQAQMQAQQQHASLSAENQALSQNLQQVQSQLEAYQQLEEEATLEQSEHEQHLRQQLQASREALEQELAQGKLRGEAQSELSHQARELATRCQQLEQHNQHLDSCKALQQSQIERLELQCQSLAEQLSQQTAQQVQREQVAIESETVLREQLTILEQGKHAAAQQIERLQQQLQEYVAKLTQQEAERQALVERRQSLKNQLAQVLPELEQYQQTEVRLQQHVAQLESKYLDNTAELSQLKTQLAAAKSQLQLSQDMAENERQRQTEQQQTELQQQLGHLQAKFGKEQQGHRLTKLALSQLEEQLLDAQIENSTFPGKLNVLTEQLNAADLLNAQLQREVKEANQDIASLSDANSKLNRLLNHSASKGKV
ncbi:hypothetical protein ACRRS0_12840 [Agarivorans sp. QJM3NY_29]|uniref:hypothetical protein n=1 Tax=unclassified Agarivorans TaxID=2636026 RepID=UPI003D7DCB4A